MKVTRHLLQSNPSLQADRVPLNPMDSSGHPGSLRRSLRIHHVLRVVFVAWFLHQSYLLFSFRVDDAYISLRYASNAARGEGLVFNRGEHVEGFTNLGLVLAEVALLHAGLDAARVFDLIGVIAIACGVWVLWLTGRLASELSPDDPNTRTFSIALVALSTCVALAAVNRLETIFFTSLVTVGALGLVSPKSSDSARWAGIAVGLAYLFRPEAALVAALIAGAEFTLGLIQQRRSRQLRPTSSQTPPISIDDPNYPSPRWAIRFSIFALCIIALVSAFRLLQFGSFFPATVLAKAPSDTGVALRSGLRYVLGYVGGWQLPLFAVGFISLGWYRGAAFFRVATLIVPYTLYVIAVGGDWIERFRFLVPVIPLSMAGASAGLGLLLRHREDGTRALRIAVVVAVLACETVFLVQERRIGLQAARNSSARTAAVSELGRWFAHTTEADASVALLDIGAFGLLADRNIIDLGGLVDPEIAKAMHSAGGVYSNHLFFPNESSAAAVAEVTMARTPTHVVLVASGDLDRLPDHSKSAGQPLHFAYPQDGAIFRLDRFRDEYRYRCHVPEEPPWSLVVFERRSSVTGGSVERLTHCVTNELPTLRPTDPGSRHL